MLQVALEDVDPLLECDGAGFDHVAPDEHGGHLRIEHVGRLGARPHVADHRWHVSSWS